MIHMSDLSWDEPGELAMTKYEKGQMVKAKVLDVDVEKERISLGIKQLRDDPAASVLDRVHKGDVVTCVVTAVQSNGIEVKVDDVLTGFIRRAELARDKSDQRPDRFAVGEKVDAKIIAVDRAARKLSLTIKGKEVEEEKQAMAEFGSSDSGASLGDILGAAIRRRNQQAQTTATDTHWCALTARDEPRDGSAARSPPAQAPTCSSGVASRRACRAGRVLVALRGEGLVRSFARCAAAVSGLITDDRKLTEAVTSSARRRQREGADRRDRQPGWQRGGRRGPARRDRPGRREEAGRRGDGRLGGIGRLHGRGARRAHLCPRRDADRLDRRTAGDRRGVRPAEIARGERGRDHLRAAEGPAQLHAATVASRAGRCCRVW